MDKSVDKFQTLTLSSSQIESLKKKATFEDCYQFLDTTVAVRSNSEGILDFLRRMYKHFFTSDSSRNGNLYYILTDDASVERPVMLWDETKACTLPRGEAFESTADTIFFNSVLSNCI